MLKRICATGAVVAATTGALLLGAPAHADTTSGNGSIAGGNQVDIPVNVPVVLCGNAVPVNVIAVPVFGGNAIAGCDGRMLNAGNGGY